jgi:hypothetical protein
MKGHRVGNGVDEGMTLIDLGVFHPVVNVQPSAPTLGDIQLNYRSMPELSRLVKDEEEVEMKHSRRQPSVHFV